MLDILPEMIIFVSSDKSKENGKNIGTNKVKCGCVTHYWKSDKECYECKKCKYRQSLRSHTVMHGSQFPFRYWFVAIHLLTTTRKNFSDRK
jgi:hypothetical protein